MTFKIFVIYLTLFVLALVTCGNKPAQPQSFIQSISPIFSSAPWQVEWEKILHVARKEGRVSVISGVGGDVRTLLTVAFKKNFGIELEYITGRGGELIEKLFAERKAGLYLQDVAMFGATSTMNILKPAGVIEPLVPHLLLPEVLDKKAWLGGEFQWIDREQLFLAFISSVNVSHYVNSAFVNAEEMKSYRGLVNPKFKGKISINDPTVTGSGNNWLGVVGEKIMGWDYIRELAKQEPVLLRDQRLQVEWMVRGRYPIGITAKTDIVQEFRRAGAELVGILPVEGSYTTVGGGTVALIKNAPHPNAARVFINWLLTREGQTLYSKGYGSPSRRLDVPTEGLDPMRIPQPGMMYFNSEEEELILARPRHMEFAREIFGHLLK